MTLICPNRTDECRGCWHAKDHDKLPQCDFKKESRIRKGGLRPICCLCSCFDIWDRQYNVATHVDLDFPNHTDHGHEV